MDPYDDREPQDVRILWGRVAALGGGLLLAFLLGTWVSGGDDGVDEDQHLALQNENERLANQVEELEDQLERLSEGQPPDDPPTVADEDEDEDDGDEDDDGDDDAGQIYTVQSGDTLSGIAMRFYGTSSEEARERIAEANDLGADATLQVGDELVIPPAED